MRCRKQRSKFAGRVGSKAEGMRATVNVEKHLQTSDTLQKSSHTPDISQTLDLTLIPDSPVSLLFPALP